MLVKMNVVGKETFTVNSITGEVIGKTYNAKEFLKDNFNAKWDKEAKAWTIDAEKFNNELTQYAAYYEKYIVEVTETAEDAKEENEASEETKEVSVKIEATKKVVEKELVNRWDGFYNKITYNDGSVEYKFVG